MPKRIQRKRTKGWKKPDGAIYVGRGSKWGNIHPIGCCPICNCNHTREDSFAEFEKECMDNPLFLATIRAELRGHDLMCWCGVSQICHGDILLRIANN
jgi:hypothetical protein